MTDKELLELAAKAAGIDGLVFNKNTQELVIQKESFTSKGNRTYSVKLWNPLTDDGDALRLAVKLKMLVQVDYSDSFRYVTSAKCWSREIESCVFASEEIEPDPYSATRRAIVRAAAEIGRAMK